MSEHTTDVRGDGFQALCSCGWESGKVNDLREAERLAQRHALTEHPRRMIEHVATI